MEKRIISDFKLTEINGMVKANELRISNSVLHDGKIIIIDGVDNADDCILVADKHIPIPCNQIRPIPLTAEWLERCGFINPDANGNAYRVNVNSQDELCWYAQDGYLRYQTQGSGFTRQLRHIKHVHQLQNWWYFFTDEELTIKEITA